MSVTFVPSRTKHYCGFCWVRSESNRLRPKLEYGIENRKIVLWRCPNCKWTYEPTAKLSETANSLTRPPLPVNP